MSSTHSVDLPSDGIVSRTSTRSSVRGRERAQRKSSPRARVTIQAVDDEDYGEIFEGDTDNRKTSDERIGDGPRQETLAFSEPKRSDGRIDTAENNTNEANHNPTVGEANEHVAGQTGGRAEQQGTTVVYAPEHYFSQHQEDLKTDPYTLQDIISQEMTHYREQHRQEEIDHSPPAADPIGNDNGNREDNAAGEEEEVGFITTEDIVVDPNDGNLLLLKKNKKEVLVPISGTASSNEVVAPQCYYDEQRTNLRSSHHFIRSPIEESVEHYTQHFYVSNKNSGALTPSEEEEEAQPLMRKRRISDNINEYCDEEKEKTESDHEDEEEVQPLVRKRRISENINEYCDEEKERSDEDQEEDEEEDEEDDTDSAGFDVDDFKNDIKNFVKMVLESETKELLKKFDAPAGRPEEKSIQSEEPHPVPTVEKIPPQSATTNNNNSNNHNTVEHTPRPPYTPTPPAMTASTVPSEVSSRGRRVMLFQRKEPASQNQNISQSQGNTVNNVSLNTETKSKLISFFTSLHNTPEKPNVNSANITYDINELEKLPSVHGASLVNESQNGRSVDGSREERRNMDVTPNNTPEPIPAASVFPRMVYQRWENSATANYNPNSINNTAKVFRYEVPQEMNRKETNSAGNYVFYNNNNTSRASANTANNTTNNTTFNANLSQISNEELREYILQKEAVELIQNTWRDFKKQQRKY
ncbi:hypothetical protein AGDE_16806 [Angomonas deanei]|uniref:Uncharacterized protein n=1 Tax=Angomonas deanei TaxID=59799 RepID=A0A7G2CB71_9TRYP|nr:hypothetical protein AGDE_16806 [Angomonas deanei]CAD2216164.1 hypothetical protein, conserved [Angomonas deanei]|eukprot:EPY16153.1 hypothetical protein AGDE_16806 [Angomonas deanei]